MTPVIERLKNAVNAHDLDALVDCFTVDYRNETPAHPGRSFVGRDQVRRNWSAIFSGVPDIAAEILRAASADDVVWSEWELHGTRVDGVPHLMRGVIVFGVRDDQAEWARFYLEPVEAGVDGVDAAIDRLTGRDARP
jgi:ketosteroid isomerase-like protein